MNSTAKVLAIIPARGGSKGIPGKNLVPIGGTPLVSISIEHALASTCVNRVVVSTDDAAISAAAREAGAEVVNRPAEISGDTASSESALLHALEVLRERESYTPDLVVFLQATSPLRTGTDIDAAIGILEDEGADSLFSANASHGFVWRRTAEGWKSFSYDHLNRPRRQDAPEDVIENGSIYVFRPSVLLETGNRLGGRVAVYRMSYADSMQIDEPEDLETIARLLIPERTVDVDERLRSLRLLVLDCDGVLTDNRVLVSDDGKESVSFSRADGYGISMLLEAGIEVAVLSKETNPVVSTRCRKLKIPCIQGVDDKLPQLIDMASQRGLKATQIAYAGNDLNDLDCMRWAGLSIAVADAVPEVVQAAAIVTRRNGGQHAVREICDQILKVRSEEQHVCSN
ncbi:MAG: acylneuraminate cytidylyltransferase [Acidobacteriota bacterium]